MRCTRTLSSAPNEAPTHHRGAARCTAWALGRRHRNGLWLARGEPLRLAPIKAYHARPKAVFGTGVFWKQLYAAAVARHGPMPELMRHASQAVATSGDPELSMLLTQQKLLSPYVMCAELDAHRVEVPSDTSTWVGSLAPREDGL